MPRPVLRPSRPANQTYSEDSPQARCRGRGTARTWSIPIDRSLILDVVLRAVGTKVGYQGIQQDPDNSNDQNASSDCAIGPKRDCCSKQAKDGEHHDGRNAMNQEPASDVLHMAGSQIQPLLIDLVTVALPLLKQSKGPVRETRQDVLVPFQQIRMRHRADECRQRKRGRLTFRLINWRRNIVRNDGRL